MTKTGVPVELVGEGGMSVCAFGEGYSSGSMVVGSLSRARLVTILEVFRFVLCMTLHASKSFQ